MSSVSFVIKAYPAFSFLSRLIHTVSIALLLLPVVLSAVLTTAFPASETRAAAQPLTLTDSDWIWTGEEASAGGSAPIGSRPFRKTIPHRSPKCAVCATILIATDDLHTLYVNGAEIGSGASSSAQVYTVGLNPESDNVIAVNGTNTGGPAGLIATVLVDYTDGTTETFVTDESWKTLKSAPPSGFANPSLALAFDITQSNWIWTNETNSAGNAPVGHRAFRKTVTSPYGKEAVCAKVVIARQHIHSLCQRPVPRIGHRLPHSPSILRASESADRNVFAVDGENTGGPAGVIATILMAYNDGTSVSYVTDTTWKTFTGLPTDFQLPATDDSTWRDATIVGKYGGLGEVTVPAA
ncbi:hypothetical protein ARMSODRAFT_1078037 [Armillaria solidipes]|uniref:Lectin n=1 Tax=Armillaria solidipes TaxID=1076256 RepID=A0A2H3CT68_9AGAR|nr:hypothetical protein ARMSODRAFT_1078037 [Armillaria solidipes]